MDLVGHRSVWPLSVSGALRSSDWTAPGQFSHLAILIGTAVTAAGVIVLKMAGRKEAADIEPAASRQATATG